TRASTSVDPRTTGHVVQPFAGEWRASTTRFPRFGVNATVHLDPRPGGSVRTDRRIAAPAVSPTYRTIECSPQQAPIPQRLARRSGRAVLQQPDVRGADHDSGSLDATVMSSVHAGQWVAGFSDGAAV